MTLTSPSNQPQPGNNRHRVTLEEFEALYVENPRFVESRFELLEGEIYEMTTMGDEHVGALGHLSYELILKLLVGHLSRYSALSRLGGGGPHEPPSQGSPTRVD